MFYLFALIKIVITIYLIIILHETIHYISSLFLKLKVSSIYIVPFYIYKKNSHIKLKFIIDKSIFTTSFLNFKTNEITSKLEYLILLKKIQILFVMGSIFDFSIFIFLFVFGIKYFTYSYLTLAALIYLCISSIHFFNYDGKFTIGSNEDERIAYDLVRNFTLCGDGYISYRSKKILTDIYINISNNIEVNSFDVNDLWNFLNNISFFTNNLLSYLNKDILNININNVYFMENLIVDFDNIKKYDYRQINKVCISIIYFSIYKKIINNDFSLSKEIEEKLLNNCSSLYHKKLYLLYFSDEINNIPYLKDTLNIPYLNNLDSGHNKLLLNIINLYNK